MTSVGLGCALALSLAACPSKPSPSQGGEPASGAAAPAAFDGAKSAREASPDGRAAQTRVVLLGTGTPTPDPRHSGPATAVVSAGRAYLVDCGPGVVRRAAEARQQGVAALDPTAISRAFITHLHSDHTAGYADLILTPAAVGRRDPLQVYGPPGLQAMTEHILAAYEEDLAVRTRGATADPALGYGVEAHEVEPGLVYEDDRVRVTAFAVAHGDWKHAYGYRFDAPDRSVVISGDTAATEAMAERCKECDVLVHEVYCAAGLEREPAFRKRYHSRYHTSAVALGKIAERARPGLLVLTHVLFFGCTEEEVLAEVRESYQGRVVMGEDLGVY